jgi:hypothetical protein
MVRAGFSRIRAYGASELTAMEKVVHYGKN